MVEISKAEGKALKEICPKYICSTVHKRHYYMVECKPAFEALNKLRSKKEK